VRKADNLTTILCAVVTKSGNLIFLESGGPLQACDGTDLPFLCHFEGKTGMEKTARRGAYDLSSSPYIIRGDQIKTTEMGGACNT